MPNLDFGQREQLRSLLGNPAATIHDFIRVFGFTEEQLQHPAAIATCFVSALKMAVQDLLEEQA